jgi:hypothetical protein
MFCCMLEVVHVCHVISSIDSVTCPLAKIRSGALEVLLPEPISRLIHHTSCR